MLVDFGKLKELDENINYKNININKAIDDSFSMYICLSLSFSPSLPYSSFTSCKYSYIFCIFPR